MSKLKKSIELQTAFADYTITDLLGEGGAGRVYGGTDSAGAQVAIKVLTNVSADKRRRFKNETAFLSKTRHPNIVAVNDHGVASGDNLKGPFYVMDRYAGNLRDILARRSEFETTLRLFGQILDGIEAAHLLRVKHRDLKPENILYNSGGTVAIADFGIASFASDQLVTLVDTLPTQRLANFQYAAPEQRTAGRTITVAADIYALGLMLNEMFTGNVPHGTDYKLIAGVAGDYAFLDRLVSEMIKQNPDERPKSISEVKFQIGKYRADAISIQRLSQITGAVIPSGEIDEPLAHDPPKLVGASWDAGRLRLTLDRPVTQEWVIALQNMGSYSSLLGTDPSSFVFQGNFADVSVREGSAQAVIDHFKVWLPRATQVLKDRLTQAMQQKRRQHEQRLRTEREAEEARIRVNQSLRI